MCGQRSIPACWRQRGGPWPNEGQTVDPDERCAARSGTEGRRRGSNACRKPETLYAEVVGDRAGNKTASVPAESVSKTVCRVAWNEAVATEASIAPDTGKCEVKVSVVEVRPRPSQPRRSHGSPLSVAAEPLGRTAAALAHGFCAAPREKREKDTRDCDPRLGRARRPARNTVARPRDLVHQGTQMPRPARAGGRHSGAGP